MKASAFATTAVAAWLFPALAWAQAASVSGRAAAAGADIPRLDVRNHWKAYQVAALNPIGSVSPRGGVAFDAIGPNAGENDQFDAVAYNGYSNYVAERYDYGRGRFLGVGPFELVGGYFGAARMDTGSDPVDAGVLMYTTEAQTAEHNGMALELDYTPNGSTALSRGLSVNAGGRGGVTIGGGYTGRFPAKGPADLGQGTVNAASDIKTGGHFRSGGPAPSLSCGTGAKVAGTDAAGFVTTGGAVTSCTISFAKAYASAPICLVQTFANAAPVAYVSSFTSTRIVVSWNTALNGGFFYLCQDAS